MLSPETGHALNTMEPGTHGALIYDSPEHERDVIFSHPSNFQKDSKLVYVGSEERPEQIQTRQVEQALQIRI